MTSGRGGGVAVYLHDAVSYSRRPDLESEQLNDLWVEIKFPSSKGMLLGTIYRPPYNANTSNWCQLMEHTLEPAQSENKEIIMMGAINIHFAGGVACNDEWQSVVESFQLTQVITSPTRVTMTTKTPIYHIYTTHPEHVRASKVGFLSARDHHPEIMLNN